MAETRTSPEKVTISKDDFNAWIESDITKNVFQELINRINVKVDAMASGGMLGPDCEARYSNAVGYIAALTEVLELEPAEVGVEYGH